MIVEIHFILHVANGFHITIQVYLHEFIYIKNAGMLKNFCSSPAIPLVHRRTIHPRNVLYIWTLRPRLLVSNSSSPTTRLQKPVLWCSIVIV